MPKAAWIVPGLLALGYAGICGLLYFRQQQLIYYPSFTRVAASATDFALQRGDVTLRGWVVNPGRHRAILYFGGNGESVEGNRAMFERWLPGHTAYLLAYRGYGASDGEPSEVALNADALALFDHVRTLHPGQPIAAVGRSLGSGVASYLAAERPVSRLVLVTPFDSLADLGQAHYRWLPVKWLLRDRYPSTAHLADYEGPVLVVRAGRDDIVPPANTDRLIASLPRKPNVSVQANAGHNSVDEDAYGRALAGFLD